MTAAVRESHLSPMLENCAVWCPFGVSEEPVHLLLSDREHLEVCHDSVQESISRERTPV